MDKLQAVVGRAWGGILKLGEWISLLVFGSHDLLTKLISASPGFCAAIVEGILIILILMIIWMIVWPKRFKPMGKPPEVIHPAKPYRLLVLSGLIALVFLAACVAAD